MSMVSKILYSAKDKLTISHSILKLTWQSDTKILEHGVPNKLNRYNIMFLLLGNILQRVDFWLK